MSRRFLVQRFDTKQALREIFTAMWFGESLYRLVELLLEVELDNDVSSSNGWKSGNSKSKLGISNDGKSGNSKSKLGISKRKSSIAKSCNN